MSARRILHAYAAQAQGGSASGYVSLLLLITLPSSPLIHVLSEALFKAFELCIRKILTQQD